MKLVLSTSDLEKIADLIASSNKDSGTVNYPIKEIELDLIVDYIVDAFFTRDISYNGCGEIVCEYVDVTIGEVYVDGWDIEVDYNYDELVELTENYIKEV